MYSIGEFAATTGLTVKALRHYDEIGLLQPASVDQHSRYRRYEVEQLRPATIIKVLREVGLGTEAIRQALESEPGQWLSSYRQEVLAQREREDAVFARAQGFFTHLEASIGVTVQDEPAQPWVAQILRLTTDEIERLNENNQAINDLFNQQAEELMGRLQEHDITATGHPWTTGRMAEGREIFEMLTVYPVDRPLPMEWGEADIEVGLLPARRELCAEWEADPVDAEYGEHLDPRAVLFLEEAHQRGALMEDPANAARTGMREDGGRSLIWVALTVEEQG